MTVVSQQKRRGRPPKARQAPEVSVSERRLEPQEETLNRGLDEAQKLIDRRLERGVHDYASQAIEFKDDRLVGRWFNEAISSQQIYRAKRNGWIPVSEGMLTNTDQLGPYSVNHAGEVVRGQRGEEHLMCMTKANQQAVMDAKTAANNARMGSTKRTKESIAEAAGRDLGPEAGDWVHGSVFGEVVDSKERIERVDPEA